MNHQPSFTPFLHRRPQKGRTILHVMLQGLQDSPRAHQRFTASHQQGLPQAHSRAMRLKYVRHL
jgi:hypothetical protein